MCWEKNKNILKYYILILCKFKRKKLLWNNNHLKNNKIKLNNKKDNLTKRKKLIDASDCFLKIF